MKAYGLYTESRPNALVWVFPSANKAFAAFGITGVGDSAYAKVRQCITTNGLYQRGPNLIRPIAKEEATAFRQDPLQITEILQKIADDQPVACHVFNNPLDSVATERLGRNKNAPKPVGLYTIRGDEPVWLFPSARKAYAAIGLGQDTTNATGDTAMRKGGGRIVHAPYYLRPLLADEVENFPHNVEDREDELHNAIAQGVMFDRRENAIRRIRCSDSQCQRGFLEYTSANFNMNNKTHARRCKLCVQRRNQERVDKHEARVAAHKREGLTSFVCAKCENECPLCQMDADRWQCRSCRKH